MGIKVTKYVPPTTLDIAQTNTVVDVPEGESFQDVLVLNQAALRAMAIDAMVANSSTGSINPDAVNAASVMKFRNTLGPNIQAPIPEDDWNPGIPQKAATASNIQQNTSTTQQSVSGQNDQTTIVFSSIYNSGVLECSEELNSYFQEAADTYDLDVNLLKCVAYAESNFNPESTSHAGAMGVMQLMPKTAEGLGVTDAYNPQQNIMGGAKYLSIQLERFEGDIELALAAYNAGPGNVQKYNGIPPFEETQNYVKKITTLYNSL